MMVLADLVFARQAWLPWAWGVAAILLCMTLLSYRAREMPIRARIAALLLRAIGVGLLLFCWLEPMTSTEQPKPQANALAILVDNSSSMKALVSDESDSEFRSLISDDASWIVRASETFRVRKYLFDRDVVPADSFASWSGDGNTSSIDRAIDRLLARFRDQPLAGIILLTDGQSTDATESTDSERSALAGSKVPIFPLRIGRMQTLPDLKIDSVSVRQSEFETAPVSMTAEISQVGFVGREAVVDLSDVSGKKIASRTLVLPREGAASKVEFRFRPEQSGVTGYQIALRLADNAAGNAEEGVALRNNRRYQVVDRGIGPYRILYLSGRPNWEFKFLRRAIDEDAELSLTSLIRIANREMKFSFRNSKLEATNPLFSGFEDVSDDEKQQYDEPVYARLGVRNSGELQKGFPKDAEELFEYSALIIDDLEHEFLTLDQQQLIRQFVAVRGGALLALGGQESMRGAEFRDSVLGQILPLYGDPDPVVWRVPELADPPGESIRYRLTREGWLQPAMRLAETESAELARLQSMPGFEVFNRTSRIKPGASVWIEGELPGEERIPIYIAQRFGRGTSAAMMIGDFWRWGLRFDGEDPSPLYQAWRQMVRAAIADVPKPIALDSAIPPENSRLSRITAHVVGRDFQAVDNAEVKLAVQYPDGRHLETTASPSDQTIGDYETEIVLKEPGVYTATASVAGPDGSSMGNATTGWVYDPEALEMARLGTDDATLRRIASRSGGRVLVPSELPSIASWLTSDRIPIKEVRMIPLWHAPWVIALAILALVLEWSLRRRYGLA